MAKTLLYTRTLQWSAMWQRSRCVLVSSASVLVLVPCTRGGVVQLYQISPDLSVPGHLALLKSCGCVRNRPPVVAAGLVRDHVESMVPEWRVPEWMVHA